MTWFNPNVYCKQNLKEKDRKELDYWNDTFLGVIDGAEIDFGDDLETEHSATIALIKREIVRSFVELLKSRLADKMQDHVVSAIEHYEGEVESVENPEIFSYMSEDVEDEDIE